jgi:hypothetical protein
MSAESPPTYYFTGIQFNSSFYADLSTAPLTQTQATALYLLKNSADTATALESFTGGILTNNIQSTSATTNMIIGSSQTEGDLNIGCNGDEAVAGRTTGKINIGTDLNGAGIIKIGNYTTITPVQIRGALTVSRSLTASTTLGVTGLLTANGGANIATGASSSASLNVLTGNTTGGTVNIANGTGATQTTVVNIGSGTTTGYVTIGNPSNNVILNGASILIANNSVGGIVQIKNKENTVGEVQIVTSSTGTNTTPVKISTGTTTGAVTIGSSSNTSNFNSNTTNIITGVGTLLIPLGGTVNIATGTGSTFVTTAVNIATGDTTGTVTIGSSNNSILLNAPTTVKSTKQNIIYLTALSNTLTVADILASNLFGSTYSSANPSTANDSITVNIPTPTAAMEGMTLVFRKVRGVFNTTSPNWSFVCPTSSCVIGSLTTTAAPTGTTLTYNTSTAKMVVMAYSGSYYYFAIF